jgi:hypothetical protein
VPHDLPLRVNQAIDDGVAYLRRRLATATLNGDDGLLGLTLLECGVPHHDPVVQRLASRLRGRALHLGGTYQLALATLFFDRLNGPGDADLVRSLALHLVAGQTAEGDWGYGCPTLIPEERRRLLAFLQTAARTNPIYKGLLRTAADGMPARLRGIGVARAVAPTAAPPPRGHTDNSNTQFAVLALWVGRRRGAPVHPALALAERHFRHTQNADGSWAYTSGGGHSRPSNTCAGLLGLAVGHGITAPAPDDGVVAGLHFLGETVRHAAPPRPGRGHGFSGVEANDDLYFFWSLERTAMIYDLEVLGDREWYPWAAERIVGAQQSDGSWSNAYPGPVDTCFALLVLRRTNLAPDLTATLRQRPPQGTSARPPGGPSGGVTTRPGPSGLGPAGPASPPGPALGPARDPGRKPGSK